MTATAPAGPVGLQVGQVAPDFELRDTHGTPVRLASLRGSPVLLVFYPFAFSRICSGELSELRDNLGVLEAANVQLFAISCDPIFSLKTWSEQEDFGFDLLSDFWPHGQVAHDYGVFDARQGMALRGSFLLDADGLIRWTLVNGQGQRRDFTDYQAAVSQL